MKPRYVIRIVPRKKQKPAVVVRFELTQELVIGPEFLPQLEGALNAIMEGGQNATHVNPNTGERIPVSLHEVGEAVLEALRIADKKPRIPKGTRIEHADRTTLLNMSLLDFVALDGRLSRICSARIEGSQPPFKMVFASGLSHWEISFSNRSQAEGARDFLNEYIANVQDPASREFVADAKDRTNLVDTVKEAIRCGWETWMAHERYQEKMRLDAENFIAHEREMRDRIEGACEPRVGENDGFRRDGGFVK